MLIAALNLLSAVSNFRVGLKFDSLSGVSSHDTRMFPMESSTRDVCCKNGNPPFADDFSGEVFFFRNHCSVDEVLAVINPRATWNSAVVRNHWFGRKFGFHALLVKPGLPGSSPRVVAQTFL